MRIGIFGGSFDPVHFGHLLLAEWSREGAQLDEVWFVPAAVSPHKSGTIATAAERVEMLKLAIAGNAAFRVSTIEVDRGGISYTVETLAAIRAERPHDELFLLMGADALCDLPSWRKPAEILALATPLVARRPGAPEPDFALLAGLTTPERLEEARRSALTMPVVDLASSTMRQRTAAGLSIRYQLPAEVAEFIARGHLYRPN